MMNAGPSDGQSRANAVLLTDSAAHVPTVVTAAVTGGPAPAVVGQAAIRGKGKRRLHPLFRDLGMTSVTEAVVMVGAFAVVSIFGRVLGATALGEYLLVRRVASSLAAGVQVGLGVALPRFVAYAVNRPARERQAYYLAALASVLALVGIAAVILLSWRNAFSALLFGSSERVFLVLPLILFVFGIAVHGAVYGYYRGCLMMKRANLLELLDLCAVPLLAVVLLRAHSSAMVIGAMGAGVGIIAVPFSVSIVRGFGGSSASELFGHARELLRYGAARVPGDFGLGALLALAPLIATHYQPMSSVSHLLLGLSILLALSSSITPLGLILLSKLSMMLVSKRHDEIRQRLTYMLGAILEMSLFMTLQAIIFVDVLVRLWVGPKFDGSVAVTRIVLMAAPFYLFYVGLRSAIDAASIIAYNARNAILSLAAMIVLSAGIVLLVPRAFLLEALAGALVASIGLLACLTAWTVKKLYDLRIPFRKSAFGIGLALGLGCASLLVRMLPGVHVGPATVLIVILSSSALYYYLLRVTKSEWLTFLWATAILRNPS